MNYKIIIIINENGFITSSKFGNILKDEVRGIPYSINYTKIPEQLLGKTVPVSQVEFNEINMRVLTLDDGMEYLFPFGSTVLLDFNEYSFTEIVTYPGKFIYNREEKKLELNPNWTELKVTLNVSM